MYRVKTAIAVIAAVGAMVCAQAAQWQNLYPSYSGLAFGDGKFVAVSEDGAIMVTDGAGERSQYFPTGRGLFSAAYGDGMFLITQSGISLISSADARNWSQIQTGVNIPCRYLTYGKDGSFVGVGDGAAAFLYEEDDWTPISPSSQTVSSLRHAAYGADRYVAAGSGIISIPSATAVAGNWTVSTGAAASSVVAFGDEKFVALSASGGMAYTSANGREWTSASASNVPAGMADMTFGGGKFVAVGAAGKAAVSSDGTAWSAGTGLNEKEDFRAVKYGNNMFMALGAHGSVYTSPDGSSWSRQSAGLFMTYRQVVYGGTAFVAVGDSGAALSGDGKNWAGKSAGKNLHGVAYGADRFVAVGDNGAIFSSANGDSWDDHSRTDGTQFTSVAFGNGIFVAVGRTQVGQGGPGVYTSNDGQDWMDQGGAGWPGTVHPTTVAFGGGEFMAGASDGTIRKTSHATAQYWFNAASATETGSARITTITYAGDKFVALGASANSVTLLSSADGSVWASSPAPANTKSATFAKGFYVAAADSGNIFASQNGSEWILQRKATNRNLQTVYFGNNALIAAGANGALLYSTEDPTIVSIRHTASRRAAPQTYGMSMENRRGAPTVKFSFTPEKAGTIAVYSLSGRQIYKKNVGIGERSVSLPERMMSNGSVIVKYAGGDGKTAVQRFQMVR